MTGGELCVCDASWVVGAAQNLTSHHLRQLKIGGLVSSRRDGRLVMYALTGRGRALVAAVLDESAPVLADSRMLEG
ncbi:ArsR family transcriptional regulator [Streptomyces sp. ID05-26A]|nr:ArsR family transcriptional regulator [Streptomyces sp. ID05-26A]